MAPHWQKRTSKQLRVVDWYHDAHLVLRCQRGPRSGQQMTSVRSGLVVNGFRVTGQQKKKKKNPSQQNANIEQANRSTGDMRAGVSRQRGGQPSKCQTSRRVTTMSRLKTDARYRVIPATHSQQHSRQVWSAYPVCAPIDIDTLTRQSARAFAPAPARTTRPDGTAVNTTRRGPGIVGFQSPSAKTGNEASLREQQRAPRRTALMPSPLSTRLTTLSPSLVRNARHIGHMSPDASLPKALAARRRDWPRAGCTSLR